MFFSTQFVSNFQIHLRFFCCPLKIFGTCAHTFVQNYVKFLSNSFVINAYHFYNHSDLKSSTISKYVFESLNVQAFSLRVLLVQNVHCLQQLCDLHLSQCACASIDYSRYIFFIKMMSF